MAKALTADDSLPLVASLTLQERVADASAYRSVPPSRDEFSADEEPLAWDAAGWEDIGSSMARIRKQEEGVYPPKVV